MCMLMLSVSIVAGAQDSTSKLSRRDFEFNMMFGRNTPVGFWGGECAYRPAIAARMLQLSAGIGIGFPEGIKLSAGLNLLPFKERRLTPFSGVSYTFASGQSFPSDDNTESIKIGSHNYINAIGGLRVSILADHGYLKLISGYSFLVGQPNITVTPGTINSGNNYSEFYAKRISSDYFIGIGIGGYF